jgi:hypothetical protein
VLIDFPSAFHESTASQAAIIFNQVLRSSKALCIQRFIQMPRVIDVLRHLNDAVRISHFHHGGLIKKTVTPANVPLQAIFSTRITSK